MSIKRVIACSRHYRVGIDRAAALSRSEPAVKAVSGTRGYGQSAVCRVICDRFAAVGAGAAVCVKAYSMCVCNPVSIKRVIACSRHYRVGINRAAALSRSEPAVKAVSGARGYGQSAVCRVKVDLF